MASKLRLSELEKYIKQNNQVSTKQLLQFY